MLVGRSHTFELPYVAIGAEVAVQQRSSAEAELIATSREWLVLKCGALLVNTALERRRADESDPLLTHAGILFAMLTGNSFSGIGQEFARYFVQSRTLAARTPQTLLRINEAAPWLRQYLE